MYASTMVFAILVPEELNLVVITNNTSTTLLPLRVYIALFKVFDTVFNFSVPLFEYQTPRFFVVTLISRVLEAITMTSDLFSYESNDT